MVTTYPLAPCSSGDGTLLRAPGPRTLAQQVTYDEIQVRRRAAIEAAARAFVDACHAADQMTPRELAEACWTPTNGPRGPWVDAKEDQIRAERGLPPLDRLAVLP